MSVDQQDRGQNAGESGWQPQPQPRRGHLRGLAGLGMLALVAGVLAVAGCAPAQEEPARASASTPSAPTQTAPSPTAPAPTNDPGDITDDGTWPEGWEKPTEEATEEPAEESKPSLTVAQENAIGAANDYLDFMAFSRKGLIHQLSSEYGSDFSVKDATFAVDHIEVNWNEQAAKAAKDYLDTMHFSRSGLIEQLESPYGGQFTHSQAVYGVNKAGL
jgi:hypothetical protein